VCSFYHCCYRLAAWRSGGFLAQKFNRRTALEPTTKLSYEALNCQFIAGAVIGWRSCLSWATIILYVVHGYHLSSALCLACISVVLFFLKRWFFYNKFSFGSALQAQLKTLVLSMIVWFVIVLANCDGYLIFC
jgi:hypothetical protein